MASQSKAPSYARPPVREAIIDIQINSLSEALLPKLKDCGAEFKTDYPKMKTGYRSEISVQVSGADMTSEQDQKVVGYIFQSSDEKNVFS